jgi:hypothetical protein
MEPIVHNLFLKKENKKFLIYNGKNLVYSKPDFITLPSREPLQILMEEFMFSHPSTWIDKIMAFETKYNPRKE